ncbi:MAG TPA: hypothetical protein VFU47_09040, partial [Armatimonadota bacterium]|nr:hypothetical protein [Armatimonadota bacterium]
MASLLMALPLLAASSLQDRLNEESLRALRRDARKLREAATPSERSGEWEDIRCIFHAHSGLSHDSRGTAEQIAAAAKAAGVRAVFMTEHPAADRKWYTDGLRGTKEGVLFVPGAELSDGLLVWRSDGTQWSPEMKVSEVLDRLKGTKAVCFIAHPEQRKEDAAWELPAFAGMEIYNSHADAADSGYEDFLRSLKGEGALKLFTLLGTLKKFPREAFAQI